MSEAQKKYPLRERKKQITRANLIEAAHKLFHKQGFENTTLQEVAERANVHVQTLYKHFRTKEDLAMAPDIAHFEEFRVALPARPQKQSTIAFWRDWVEDHAKESVTKAGKMYLSRVNARERIPSLAVASLQLWQRYEDELTLSIAKDMNVDPESDLRPRLIACMLWGGNNNAVRRWVASNGKLDLTKLTLKVIDEIVQMKLDVT